MQRNKTATSRKTATERAYQSLLARIQYSNIEVGDRLPSELVLCKELKFGRGTIREASRIMQTRGFLEIRPGIGTFVVSKTGINPNELSKWFKENRPKILDILQVRRAIEPMSTKLAIERCTSGDIDKLLSIHNCAINAAKEKDSTKLAIYDEDFHSLVTSLSRNKVMIEIGHNINNILKEFRGKTFLVDSNINNFIPSHEKILNAFISRNPVAGADFMYQHLTLVMQDLKKNEEGL